MDAIDESKLNRLISFIGKFAVDQYGYIKSYQKENDSVYYKCDFEDALITLFLKHNSSKTIIRYVLGNNNHNE